METFDLNFNRRSFVLKTVSLTAGMAGLNLNSAAHNTLSPTSPYVIGPQEGYSPLIGSLVSMLNYNRYTVVEMVKDLTIAQLDYLHDSKANTIGAMLLHLGATDKYYQINTFEGRQDFNDEEKKAWGAAMHLGDEGRNEIKGHEVSYYLDRINTVRQKTLDELKKKDDQWLLAIDPIWSKE